MFSEPDLGNMLKVNEKDSRMTTLSGVYIFVILKHIEHLALKIFIVDFR